VTCAIDHFGETFYLIYTWAHRHKSHPFWLATSVGEMTAPIPVMHAQLSGIVENDGIDEC